MAAQLASVRRSLMVLAFALTAISGYAADESTAPGSPEMLSPLRGPSQSVTGDELFAKLLEHNQRRDTLLDRYSAVRTYRVANDKGKIYAEEVVRMEYEAPNRKHFVIASEEGSTLVRGMVLKRLIESESETSSGRAHRDSSIKPANYEFTLVGEQDLGAYHCFVVDATPKRRDKYLFEGKVWIDAHDYAIVRIAGHPAKSLSFWITRADFVRQYQKIGEFWLPARDETLVDVRVAGKKILTIDHLNYSVNRGAVESGHDLTSQTGASVER